MRTPPFWLAFWLEPLRFRWPLLPPVPLPPVARLAGPDASGAGAGAGRLSPILGRSGAPGAAMVGADGPLPGPASPAGRKAAAAPATGARGGTGFPLFATGALEPDPAPSPPTPGSPSPSTPEPAGRDRPRPPLEPRRRRFPPPWVFSPWASPPWSVVSDADGFRDEPTGDAPEPGGESGVPLDVAGPAGAVVASLVGMAAAVPWPAGLDAGVEGVPSGAGA